MNKKPPRPMCFVAMPFGKKAPPGKKKPVIDFDNIFKHVERAVDAEKLECVRADFDPTGGFIHKPMYESLLVGEYVIADLTFSNPNVTYEVGVRHGATARPTILIGAEGYIDRLPFDFRPLRVFTYKLDEGGGLGKKQAEDLVDGLRKRLQLAIQGGLAVDNPITQVTGWNPAGRLEHDKTDVFLKRLEFASEVGKRISLALARADNTEAIKELATTEEELLKGPEVVAELHSALLGIYLGYREKKAYQKMVDLFSMLPKDLRKTPVVQEQYALAINRLAEKEEDEAEKATKEADEQKIKEHRNRARELRTLAINTLDEMPPNMVTSETLGIHGRIYKGWYEAEEKAGNTPKAKAMLGRAIETYELGIRADMRDYYPGVNAVTLRLQRGKPKDLLALEALVPVVRLAVECAPEPESEEERYWQTATKLELASAAKDWEVAENYLTDLLGINAAGWMLETTAKNLEIQQRAFREDAKAVKVLSNLIGSLNP